MTAVPPAYVLHSVAVPEERYIGLVVLPTVELPSLEAVPTDSPLAFPHVGAVLAPPDKST